MAYERVSLSLYEDAPTGPGYVNARVLAANTAETITAPAWPAGTKILVSLSANADIYARWDGNAAAVPAADVTDGTGSELNPTLRKIAPSGTVSVVCAGAAIVTASFWQV